MKYICSLLFIVIYANAYAVPNVCTFVSGIRQVKADTDTTVKKMSVSAGVSYGSDASFFGRTGPIKYPFVTSDVIYNSRSGFFIYGSAYKVLGYNHFMDETDLGAGYLYKFSKKFSGSVSYTRFIFDKNAEIIKSSSSNDIDLKNSFDWKIKSTVTLDYLFGTTSDIFLTIGNSKYFETNWSIFDDKDYLSFTPAFNVILGTQNFVEKYSKDRRRRHEEFLLTDGLQSRANRQFNLLNYSFKIPVAYNRPHYTVEASWKYSIPVHVEGALLNHRESFFNLTFFYVFY